MSKLRTLNIDPGIGKCGWSVLDFTFDPFCITEVIRGTFDGNKLLRTRKELKTKFQDSYCKLDALEESIESLILQYQPDEIVIEGAFDHQYPATIISLTLVIGAVRRLCHKHLDKDVRVVAPRFTKMAFANHGNADKDLLRKTYLSYPRLIRYPEGEPTEHEIDATAHGIAYVLRDVLKTVVEKASLKKKKK